MMPIKWPSQFDLRWRRWSAAIDGAWRSVSISWTNSTWSRFSGVGDFGSEATAAADAEAVQIHLECNAEDVVDVRFDDLVLARP